MTFKARLNTFETNSSSAHTVVLTSDTSITTDEEINDYLKYINKMYFEKDGSFYLPMVKSENNYDQTFEILNEWQDKYSYLVASLDADMKENIIKAIQTRIPKCKGIAIRFFEEEYFDDVCIIPFNNNNGMVIYDDSKEIDELYGRIDHQSYGLGNNIIRVLENSEKYKGKSIVDILAEIIFSKQFVIIVESDCESVLDTLVDCGFFNDAMNIEKIYIENGHWDKETDEWVSNPKFITFDEYQGLQNQNYNNEDDE